MVLILDGLTQKRVVTKGAISAIIEDSHNSVFFTVIKPIFHIFSVTIWYKYHVLGSTVNIIILNPAACSTQKYPSSVRVKRDEFI